jgi:hypothetical protein
MGSVWEGFIRFESSREHGVFVEKLPKKAVMINTYGLPSGKRDFERMVHGGRTGSEYPRHDPRYVTHHLS